MPEPGRLVLVATPLGNLADLSPRAAEALASADLVACEDTRHTRKLFSASGIRAPALVAVHGHNERTVARGLVERMAGGAVVALVSDAGTPAISDPGQRLVAEAVRAGIDVTIVPGPSAGVAALAVSGLPTDRYVFEGFLPRRGGNRSQRLRAVAAEERTVVLFEAPHRLEATLADLEERCGQDRRVVLVRELTKRFEEVWRGTVGQARARAAEVEARGEYVVVVEGAHSEPAGEEEIEAALRQRLAAGEDRKAAVAAVAAALEVPKRAVYAVGLRLAQQE